MNKVFSQIKKYWLTNLITFLVSLAVGAGIFCIVFFTRTRSMIDAIDGATLGGLIVLLFGLLMMVAHFGTFDFLVFGFKQLIALMFAKDPKKHGQFTDYRDEMTQKRRVILQFYRYYSRGIIAFNSDNYSRNYLSFRLKNSYKISIFYTIFASFFTFDFTCLARSCIITIIIFVIMQKGGRL